MNELIQIQPTYIQQQEVQTVNARDLHRFLESKRDFSNWITSRIEQYGFIEEVDFTTVLLKSTGGRPSKEYFITISMAKELSMVERTQRGRQARLYFIEKEQQANDLMLKLNDPVFLRDQLANYSQKLIQTEAQRDEAIRTKAHISSNREASSVRKVREMKERALS